MPAACHGYKMMAACRITCNNLLQKWITLSMATLQMFQWYWHVMLRTCACGCDREKEKMWDPLLMHLVIPKILCDCMHSINAHIQLYWHRTNSLHLCLHMACNNVGLSWSSRSWHAHLSLLTCSWHVEPSHDQCLLHKQHHGWHTTTYEFQHVDNLLLWETELLPSGPIWMDSPPHMRSWICIVILYIY